MLLRNGAPLPDDHWARWYGATCMLAPPRRQRWERARERADKAASGTRGYIWYAGRCRECGDWFTTLQPAQVTCSKRCARSAGKSRRRALQHAAFVAPVYRLAVFERDIWTCRLCGGKVKRGSVAPHPLAPTIDHIIPLATGGTHEPANCQTAHFICKRA